MNHECYWHLFSRLRGVIYRSRNYSKTSIPPKLAPAGVTAHKAGILEHTLKPTGSQQAGECSFRVPQLDLTSSRQLRYSLLPLPRPPAAGLVSESLQTGLVQPEGDSQLLLLTVAGRSRVILVRLSRFLKLFWVSAFLLKELSSNLLRKLLHNTFLQQDCMEAFEN